MRCWKPFPVHLLGLQESHDGYLFLTVREGSSDLVELHRNIYTGPLRPYLREDIPFVPHLTLGAFSDRASKEAKILDLDLRCELESLHLVRLVDDRSQILWSKELFLSM